MTRTTNREPTFIRMNCLFVTLQLKCIRPTLGQEGCENKRKTCRLFRQLKNAQRNLLRQSEFYSLTGTAGPALARIDLALWYFQFDSTIDIQYRGLVIVGHRSEWDIWPLHNCWWKLIIQRGRMIGWFWCMDLVLSGTFACAWLYPIHTLVRIDNTNFTSLPTWMGETPSQGSRSIPWSSECSTIHPAGRVCLVSKAVQRFQVTVKYFLLLSIIFGWDQIFFLSRFFFAKYISF